MKTELKAKLLQHLAGKKRDGGFTLIELLVVIIIIGILAAIALPSFLNQANKAKESEAKQYVGAATRGQQAYFLENNTFTTSFSRLELGLSGTAKGNNILTTNYEYSMAVGAGDVKKGAIIVANSQTTTTLRSYIGATETGQAGSGEGTTLVTVCTGEKPSGAAAGNITVDGLDASAPLCGAGFKSLAN
jgi:type IV pilus assembly protein PilA